MVYPFRVPQLIFGRFCKDTESCVGQLFRTLGARYQDCKKLAVAAAAATAEAEAEQQQRLQSR